MTTLFNGSHLGQRPTGLGVVARDLVAALNPEQVRLLDPGHHGSGARLAGPLAAGALAADGPPAPAAPQRGCAP